MKENTQDPTTKSYKPEGNSTDHPTSQSKNQTVVDKTPMGDSDEKSSSSKQAPPPANIQQTIPSLINPPPLPIDKLEFLSRKLLQQDSIEADSIDPQSNKTQTWQYSEYPDELSLGEYTPEEMSMVRSKGKARTQTLHISERFTAFPKKKSTVVELHTEKSQKPGVGLPNLSQFRPKAINSDILDIENMAKPDGDTMFIPIGANSDASIPKKSPMADGNDTCSNRRSSLDDFPIEQVEICGTNPYDPQGS
jgi:hypothetical protein